MLPYTTAPPNRLQWIFATLKSEDSRTNYDGLITNLVAMLSELQWKPLEYLSFPFYIVNRLILSFSHMEALGLWKTRCSPRSVTSSSLIIDSLTTEEASQQSKLWTFSQQSSRAFLPQIWTVSKTIRNGSRIRTSPLPSCKSFSICFVPQIRIQLHSQGQLSTSQGEKRLGRPQDPPSWHKFLDPDVGGPIEI